jgi:hypothetical protein
VGALRTAGSTDVAGDSPVEEAGDEAAVGGPRLVKLVGAKLRAAQGMEARRSAPLRTWRMRQEACAWKLSGWMEPAQHVLQGDRAAAPTS